MSLLKISFDCLLSILPNHVIYMEVTVIGIYS